LLKMKPASGAHDSAEPRTAETTVLPDVIICLLLCHGLPWQSSFGSKPHAVIPSKNSENPRF
jgi:hypothetical protein